ncbi:MAG: hypothetical protein AAGF13_06855 [Pseudomonadota bacterium]
MRTDVNGIKKLAVSAAFSLISAAAVHAQGLEIAPLTLDVAPDDETGLVLAALDTSDAAPQIASLGAGQGALIQASLTQAGLPQPSIIIGVIAPGQEASFGIETLLPATVESIAFEIDDLDARDALRERDVELFRQLIEEGHLDPEELERALQIELSRMNCYRSGIDGAWGPGSRRSVTEYFAQLEGVDWPDQAPTVDLFRAILINGDVACPTPQPVARTNTSTSSTRTTPTRTTTTTTPPTTQQPAATPSQPSRPTLSGGGTGSGVFR